MKAIIDGYIHRDDQAENEHKEAMKILELDRDRSLDELDKQVT